MNNTTPTDAQASRRHVTEPQRKAIKKIRDCIDTEGLNESLDALLFQYVVHTDETAYKRAERWHHFTSIRDFLVTMLDY